MISTMPDGLQRMIEWEPAFDRRDSDPKKNYGIHGLTLRFILMGPRGATQFVIYTNWQLRHVWSEQDTKPVSATYPHLLCRPMAADLGYHSPTPIYDSQTPMGAYDFDYTNAEEVEGIAGPFKIPKRVATGTFWPCRYVNNGPCFYDGSSLQAEELLTKFIAEGEEVVWKRLQESYEYLISRQDERKREATMLRCPVETCQKTFFDRAALKEHVIAAHGYDPIVHRHFEEEDVSDDELSTGILAALASNIGSSETSEPASGPEPEPGIVDEGGGGFGGAGASADFSSESTSGPETSSEPESEPEPSEPESEPVEDASEPEAAGE